MSFFSKDRPVRLLILLIPMSGLVIYIGASEWFYKLPFYIDYDPEMAYFFSALSLFTGKPITYIDHPGTPLQMLGALLFWLTAPFLRLSGEDLVRYHTLHPEVFLNLARTAILLLNVAAVSIVGSVFFQRRSTAGHLLAAALTALFFIANPLAINLSSVFTHNAFNFFGGSLLLTMVYRVFRRGGFPRMRDVALYSFAAGVLTAVTLYFATWAFGILAAFALWAIFTGSGLRWAVKIGALSIASALLGFFISTLPILDSYPRLFQWIADLATHTGFYGTGEVGIVPLSTLFQTVYGLLKQSPVFTILLLVTAPMLYASYRLNKNNPHPHPGRNAFLVAMILQLVAAIFLVAKHPQLSYFVSTTAILIPLLGAAIESILVVRPVPTWAALAVSVLVITIFASSILANINERRSNAALIRAGEAMVSAQLDQIALDRGIPKTELKVLRAYHVFDPCLAILYGDQYNAYQFGRYATDRCAHSGNLDVVTGMATYGQAGVALARIDWDVIVVREFELGRLIAVSNFPPHRIIHTQIKFNSGYHGPTMIVVREK